jgi:hypothetical protein
MSALCSLYLISYEFLYGSFFYTMILAQISGLLLLSQTKQFLHLTSQNSFHNYVLGSYIDFYACLIIIILAYWPDLRTVNLSVCTYDCILRAESKTGNYLECKTPPPHTHTHRLKCVKIWFPDHGTVLEGQGMSQRVIRGRDRGFIPQPHFLSSVTSVPPLWEGVGTPICILCPPWSHLQPWWFVSHQTRTQNNPFFL